MNCMNGVHLHRGSEGECEGEKERLVFVNWVHISLRESTLRNVVAVCGGFR